MGDIITVATEAAREAGAFLQRNFGAAIQSIERKADKSLATNLDREAERMIVDRIKRHFPRHGIIAEECGTYGSAESSTDSPTGEYTWIIDPLDGTHNFIRGIPVFGVSIGVMRRGEFVAGVIYLPVSDEFYTAEKGSGAFKNNMPIKVSAVADLAESTVSYDTDLRTQADLKLSILKEVAAASFNLRMFGASVRTLTYLAEGKIDAAIEFNDKPWDFAGGACILQEAGGKITTFQGAPLGYENTCFIASNGFLHEPLRRFLID